MNPSKLFTYLTAFSCLAGCTKDIAPSSDDDSSTLTATDTLGAETVGSDNGGSDVTVPTDSGLSDSAGPDPDVSLPDGSVVDADPCLSDEDYFQTHLWEPTLSTKCFVCHNGDGIAKNSDFVLIAEEEMGAFEANFNVTKAIALTEFAGSSILLSKPTNLHPKGHTGGKQFELNSGEHLFFKHFVERVTGTADGCEAESPDDVVDCSNVDPGRRQLRRLSHFEYDNTVTDLFGFESKWGANFTVDVFHHGFDNHGPSLGVTPLLAEQYRKAAEDIATKAMENKWSLLPCTPVGGQDDVCALDVIKTLGARIFRRPLTDADISRYQAIYDLGKTDGFDSGITWTLIAMLQSPHFLYRPELGEHVGGGVFELNGFEIASQLSYFLWGSMPDKELMDAASDGTLLTDEGLLAQTKRLIADPRRLHSVRHFTHQWLDVNNLRIATKDTELYPKFTDDVREGMLEETARFFAHVMFESTGTLPELFVGQTSMLNAALADFYGLDVPGLGADYEAVSLKDVPYGGVLTHGSVLAAHAFSNSSSPIHRGVMVRERILCQELPPPPPGVIVQIPPLDPELTTRERFMAHAEVEPCFGCHQLIDPIGFGFENFDAVGQHRLDEGGIPIDASGDIVGSQASDGTFDGVSEMSALLSESPEVHDCFARQVLRYAYGFGEEDGIGCLVRKVEQDFKDSELNLAGLFTDLTQTVHFRTRIGEEPEPIVVDEEPESDTFEEDTTTPEDVEEDTGPEPTLVDIKMVMQSEWQTGYCADIFVTNISDETIIWSFVMPVEGEITTIWNATATEAGDELLFEGVDWNKELAPDAQTSFGFCAAK